jgi:hypothetical protein
MMPEKHPMKPRFRLAAATAVLALLAAFVAGCATRGSSDATASAAAPVADAEWHSLVKSGRAAYLRNDFKAALPLFASAAKRSRALDDPNGLAVALLDQARCLEEMEYASMLAGFEETASGDSWPLPAMKDLEDRTRLAMELRAAMADSRLSAGRRGELAVAWVVCRLPEDDAVLLEAVPDPALLPPAAQARYFIARATLALSGDAEAARGFLAEIPADAVLPDAQRARLELLEGALAEMPGERLDRLEAAASVFRSAGRPDGVAFALLTGGQMEPSPADGARIADMAVRAASACQALGYGWCALKLLDSVADAGEPSIRERAAALRKLISGSESTTPKGEPEP